MTKPFPSLARLQTLAAGLLLLVVVLTPVSQIGAPGPRPPPVAHVAVLRSKLEHCVGAARAARGHRTSKKMPPFGGVMVAARGRPVPSDGGVGASADCHSLGPRFFHFIDGRIENGKELAPWLAVVITPLDDRPCCREHFREFGL